MSSGSQFTITTYGQDRLVMDWFGLQDPFDQYMPVKITNNWSGSLWFGYNLVNPPPYYSNFSGALSGVLATTVPLTAGSTATYALRWAVSISGALLTSGGPSPNTDNLTANITAFVSGFFSGALSSGSIAFSNVLFNRYSGVIKMFGEQYNGDVPTTTLTLSSGTGYSNSSGGQIMGYFLTYNQSGWESDPGAYTFITVNSGTTANITLTWTAVPEATQYFIWRHSGNSDPAAFSPLSGASMELIGVTSGAGTSFVDTAGAALQTMYRYRYWNGMPTIGSPFLSPPSSIGTPQNLLFTFHTVQLNKNLSGTSLLGPFYVILHEKSTGPILSIYLQAGNNSAGFTSGQIVANTPFAEVNSAVWNRYGFYVSGGASGTSLGVNSSGYVHLQMSLTFNAFTGGGQYDDVFIVAVS